jgi:chitinase
MAARPNAAPTVQIDATGACGGADTTAIALNDTGNSSDHCDTASNTGQFNWKTNGLASGCYDIYLQSGQSGQGNGGYSIQLK